MTADDKGVFEIPLTRGCFAIVDAADYAHLKDRAWFATNSGYAARMIRGKTTFMHRLIACPGEGQEVDHINGNKLDNRRSNLRCCSHLENCFNRKNNKNNSSGYRGVYRDKRRPSWRSYVRVGRKQCDLGSFKTAEDAARAYDASAKKLYGEFARLNFPVKP